MAGACMRELLVGKCRRLRECADVLGLDRSAEECSEIQKMLALCHTDEDIVRHSLRNRVCTQEAFLRSKKGNRKSAALLKACEEFSEALARLECKVPKVTTCEECYGVMREDPRACAMVCEYCNMAVPVLPEDSDVVKIVTAVKLDVDHKKNSIDYLRKLQGRCSIDATREELDAIRTAAVRDRITHRNISLQWFRSILQELELTKFNPSVPALMRSLFDIEIPQLTESEEREIVDGMVHDNAVYMEMRRDEGKRGNALAYPYNSYRQIDIKFPPGHPKRQLLNLINLQGALTLQKHEDTSYEICHKEKRVQTSIGPPPLRPFKLIS